MEYQVPQFIEVEDKIFGPLTLKQFIYLAGGLGMGIGLILYLPFVLGVILAIPFVALGAGLAFYKVNGKPLLDIIEAGVVYFFSRRLYLWHKGDKVAEQAAAPSTEISMAPQAPKQKLGLTDSRLQELAYSLDSKAPPTSHE